MQSVIKLPSKSVARSARQLQTPDARATNELRQPIATGKAIFQPGEGRRLYRIESGAVCHFSQSADGRFEVIEFAFPSVIIGLGYLPTHTSTAVAMVDTSVNIVTAKELEQLLLSDDRLALRTR